MSFKLDKKGQFGQLVSLAVGIAGLAIALVVTFLVISQGRENIVSIGQGCENTSNFFNATVNNCCAQEVGCIGANLTGGTSAAFNATQTLGSAVDTIPGWVPLIVVAFVGAILLGLVALFRTNQS